MADKYQHEAGRTLRAAGFIALKNPDFYKGNGKNIYPVANRPDTFFAGPYGSGGFVEVKTGRGTHQQRFPFAEWRDDQRQWYYEHVEPVNAAYWLFIVLGRHVRHAKYPRTALLITAERLLQFESTATRQSMSFSDAISLDDGVWCLDWAGDSLWDIRQSHPFYQLHVKETPQ